ncbi:hypothetical protein KI387_023629, partial [Taxus chinensis]
FTDMLRLNFNAEKLDCDYYTLRKKYVYPGRSTYTERKISKVLNIKLISLAIADLGAVLVYLQLKLKMENKKYMEFEFTLLAPHKVKHIMESVPMPKPIEKIEIQDEEEEREDSGGLDHRGWRHPTSQKDVEHA